MAGPADWLTEILNQVTGYETAAVANASEISSLRKSQQSIAEDSANALSKLSTNQQVVTAAEISRTLEMDALRKRVAAEVDVGSQIAEAVKKATAASAAKQDALSKLAQVDAINPLSNPIGYIVGQMKANSYIRQHNTADAIESGATNSIRVLNELVDQGTKAGLALQSKISESEAAARIESAGAESQTKANDFKLRALQFGVDEITDLRKQNLDSISLKFQTFGAKVNLEQLRLQQGAAARAEEHFEYQKAQDKLRLDRIERDDAKLTEMQNYVTERIVAGAQARGVDVTKDMVGLKFTVQQILAGNTKSPFYADFLRGEGNIVRGDTALGATPATALRAVVQQEVVRTDAEKPILTLIADAEKAVSKSQPGIEKDPVKYNRAINDEVDRRVKARQSGFDPEDATKPFGLSRMVDVVKFKQSDGELNNYPAFTKVIKPAMDSGLNVDNPELVLKLLSEGMKSGELTSKDVRDVSKIFALSHELNVANMRAKRYSVLTERKFVLRVGAALATHPFDLTKPDELQNAVMYSGMGLGQYAASYAVAPPGILRKPFNPAASSGDQ